MISSFVELLMRAFAAIYLASIFGFVGLCMASPLAWIGGAAIVAGGYFASIRKMSNHLKQGDFSFSIS